jgi:hypothetical protein
MDFVIAVIVFIIIWGFIASYMNNSGGTPGPRGGGEDDGYGYMSDEDVDNWWPPED